MSSPLPKLPHMFIQRQMEKLKKDYESLYDSIEIEFQLEEKDWSFFNMTQKFNKKDSVKALYNFIKKVTGHSKELQVFFFPKLHGAKKQFDFSTDMTIQEYFEREEIVPNQKHMKTQLHFNFQPGSYDPLYLC